MDDVSYEFTFKILEELEKGGATLNIDDDKEKTEGDLAAAFITRFGNPKVLLMLIQKGLIYPERLIQEYSRVAIQEDPGKNWKILSGCYLCMVAIGK